jgi:spore germination protein GerM
LIPSPRRGPALFLAFVLLGSASSSCRRDGAAQRERQAPQLPGAPTSALPFNLYFPTTDGTLRAVRRTLEVTQEPAQRAHAVLQALLAGPREDGLLPVFEQDTEIASTLLTPSGVLYVDLRSPGNPAPPSLGSRDELLTVYSLVNTAVLNVPETRRVVLLWNGTQLESLGGHVDTARALRPNHGLVAPPAAAAP